MRNGGQDCAEHHAQSNFALPQPHHFLILSLAEGKLFYPDPASVSPVRSLAYLRDYLGNVKPALQKKEPLALFSAALRAPRVGLEPTTHRLQDP
jgi:hypothetical protein